MSNHETAKFRLQPFGVRCEIFMCTSNAKVSIGGSDACPATFLNICLEDAESLIRSTKDIPELAAITKEVGLKIAKKGEEAVLREAKSEADKMIKEAKAEMQAIIKGTDIIKAAEAQAEQIILSAKADAAKLLTSAMSATSTNDPNEKSA